MLPACLSFLITGDGVAGRAAAVRRALAATAAMTAVFGVFGLAIAPVAGQIQRHLPWVTIGIGAGLVGIGGWLLAGRSLPGLRLRSATGRKLTRTLWSMATFGAAYAVASLSCTIGPFLAIMVTGFRAGSPAEGVALFLAYAGGTGLTVAAAALAVALAHGTLVGRLRRAAPLVSRLGGLLLAAGVAYYGWWQTRVLAGDTTTDPVIDTAASVQRWLAATVEWAGSAMIAAIVAVLTAAGLAVAWATARRGRSNVDR